jgi:hypothetical protein
MALPRHIVLTPGVENRFSRAGARLLHAPALHRATRNELRELERLRGRIEAAQGNCVDGTQGFHENWIQRRQRQEGHGQRGSQEAPAQIPGDVMVVRAGSVLIEEAETHRQGQNGQGDGGSLPGPRLSPKPAVHSGIPDARALQSHCHSQAGLIASANQVKAISDSLRLSRSGLHPGRLTWGAAASYGTHPPRPHTPGVRSQPAASSPAPGRSHDPPQSIHSR